MPEVKLTVEQETLDFLTEMFPDGISDADKIRIAVGILRYTAEEDRDGLKDYLREQGVEDLDFEEMYVRGVAEFFDDSDLSDVDMQDAFAEGVKRAILESGDISLSDSAGLVEDENDSE